jgi:Uma2 family endonuclease
MSEEACVLVAGGGPVGLACALAPGEAGVPVRLFEAGPDVVEELRASTWHPPTLELLDDFGLAAPLLEQGLVCPSWQVRMHPSGEKAEFDLAWLASETRHPYRLQCEQWRFSRAVVDRGRARRPSENAPDLDDQRAAGCGRRPARRSRLWPATMSTAEVIEQPLTADALGAKFRELCDDPRFANVPGKIELDVWGRILMSPASNLHGILQSRLVMRMATLGGQPLVEASIITPIGVLVADVAWASAEFMRRHGTETPFSAAPELCVEIASPSNSRKELREKVDAYLAAGAVEAWIGYSRTRRFEFFGRSGQLPQSSFAIDLAGLFD